MGPASNLHQLVVKKDVVPTIFNFLVESCNLPLGQKTTKKQDNYAYWIAGKLLGHFPSKIKFVFRFKTFLKNNTLTQRHSNVQHNSDITIPSIKVHSHLRNLWSLQLPLLLNFSSFKELRKKNFRICILLIFLTFCPLKMAAEKMQTSCFIWPWIMILPYYHKLDKPWKLYKHVRYTLITIYNSWIQPSFDYCDMVWDNLSKGLATRLQKLLVGLF